MYTFYIDKVLVSKIQGLKLIYQSTEIFMSSAKRQKELLNPKP